MKVDTFWTLVKILSKDPNNPDSAGRDNPLFYRPGPRGPGRPDTPLEIQLAAFLRYSARHTHVSAARETATGEGSTYNFITNISLALLNLKSTYIHMPSTFAEKQAASDGFGLVGAMSAVDGTLLCLKNRPPKSQSPMAFYCRKKFYGLALQAFVSHDNLFTAIDGGWPASVTDITVLEQSTTWRDRNLHLAEGEFWLADKGYKVTPKTVRTFSVPELNHPDRQRRERFNAIHAGARVVVEHTFGIFQNRFPILFEIPGKKILRIWDLIYSLTVLHNIVTKIDGFWDGEEDLGGVNEVVGVLLVEQRRLAAERLVVLNERRDAEDAVAEGGRDQIRVDGWAFRQSLVERYC